MFLTAGARVLIIRAQRKECSHMKVWLPRNAKRLAALTLTLVLVLALAACGSKTQTAKP